MPLLTPDALRAVRSELSEGSSVHEVARLVRRHLPRLHGPDVVTAVHEVLADVVGLGPLRDAVALPGVTDVLVCGPGTVYVERNGELHRVETAWADEDALRAFAVRLATSAQTRLDQLHPYADFLLPGGLRCHVVLPPLAASTAISVRIPRRHDALTLAEVVTGQPDEVADVLADVVRARRSYVISGGTGTGKTTLLAAMVAASDPGERVVIVEDAAELPVVHPHAVHLRARAASSEGVGEVTMRTMVRQALRMRPDRLIVGEVRGAEVVDLLAAMNTGHEGGGATVHANSAAHVRHRMRTLCLMAGVPAEAADALFATAVEVVIHLDRDSEGRRRVAQLAVVSEQDGAVIPALDFRDRVQQGAGFAQLESLLASRR